MHARTWSEFREPNPNLRISVVLPVRNESAGLTSALSALAQQQCLNGRPFELTCYEVLVLANNCDDGSAELAREFARCHPELQLHIAEVKLPPELANIGYVRRLLMDQACHRLGTAGYHDAWIASTDADTVVALDWLASNERELAAGAHAVGGRIRFGWACPIESRILRYQRLDTALHLARSRLEDLLDPDPLDPWPRHHQHFGASLAVTRHAYLRVGGLPHVAYLEDQALVDLLRKCDLSVRHSPHVQVMTSARQNGRAEVGLAWQLRQWAQGNDPVHDLMVEHVDDWLQRVYVKRELRLLWQSSNSQDLNSKTPLKQQWTDLAKRLGVRQTWLMSQAASARSFGALWEKVRSPRERHKAAPSMTMRAAIHQIRILIANQIALAAVPPNMSIQ